MYLGPEPNFLQKNYFGNTFFFNFSIFLMDRFISIDTQYLFTIEKLLLYNILHLISVGFFLCLEKSSENI